MALNIKEILTDGLLELNKTQSLSTITIKQLLSYTKVSKQSFYNHFLDKNHLIQYIYETKIIPDFNDDNLNLSFYDSLVISFENMLKYKKFMKEACKMEGQNCLKDYIYQHCRAFDLKFHKELYGGELPETLYFATEYHATASSSMTLSWILSDMNVDVKEMAQMITQMRSIGMEKLFEKAGRNPYEITKNTN
ncbi:MAG: TetR family transcriptional regulator C-terminal domain-containing protein [Erysipelotrichaceae bacterium]|nr:TetR family transcriptional regulator C-terminal domain-containing protein [Erysipelotrichaceae bacterium]